MLPTLIDRHELYSCLQDDLQTLRGISAFRGKRKIAFNYSVERQLSDINRKQDDGMVSEKLQDLSIAKFFANQERLSRLDFDPSIISSIRCELNMILPNVSDVEEEIFSRCCFGPGSVFQAKGPRDKSIQYKIGKAQTCAGNTRQLLFDALSRFPNWVSKVDCKVTYIPGNRAAFVPKDIVKCRQIAVEPSLNVFIQKGIGSFLTHILRQIGIDLSNQEKHRLAVRRSWKTIGTIDLSDASDSISVALMKAVLPSDWYELLDAARSKYTLIRGEWVKPHSFSSQGNAFTFPLETLIFYVACKAVCRNSELARDPTYLSVYGDDILADKESCTVINREFPKLGFVVNTEKSFWGQHEGLPKYFRESCGEDTLFGISVRPVYYKQDATHPSMVMALANRLYEKWGRLPRTHRYLSSIILLNPRFKYLLGPRVYWNKDDTCFTRNTVVTSYSEWFWFETVGETPPRCPDSGIRTLYWSNKPKSLPSSQLLAYEVRLLAFLFNQGGDPDNMPVMTRKLLRRTIFYSS